MLTPWPLIARRLEAAARGDFVTAIYNPKSSRRPDQLREARDLFMRHRDPRTPVAVVRAAYRQREAVQLTTLAEMADAEVSMLTSLIIGNASSFTHAGLMVTPRGYGLKYQLEDGSARPGESPRQSLSSGLAGWRRALVEGALSQGIETTCREQAARPSDLLEALAAAEISPWRVIKRTDSPRLLEEALGWPDARLRMGTADAGRVALSLEGARVDNDSDLIQLAGPGWRIELPHDGLALAWEVSLPTGRSAWFAQTQGEPLWWIG
jgi:precorrin-3B C17-methyltransferase